MMKRTLITAVAALLIVGTAQGAEQPFYWSKPGGTLQQLNSDRYQCAKENTTTEVQITNQLFGDYNVQKRQTVNPAMLVACLKAHGWMIVRSEQR